MIVHYLLRQWDAHASRASMDLAMAGHVHCTLDDLEKNVWICMDNYAYILGPLVAPSF